MSTPRISVRKTGKKTPKPLDAGTVEQTVEVFDLTAETAPDGADEVVAGIVSTYLTTPTRKEAKELKAARPDLKGAILQVSAGQRRLSNECLSPWQRALDWTRQGNIKGTICDVLKVTGGAALVILGPTIAKMFTSDE